MERDNRAGMDSDGIIHGGDASFGAPDQAQLSTFHTTLVDDCNERTNLSRAEMGVVPLDAK